MRLTRPALVILVLLMVSLIWPVTSQAQGTTSLRYGQNYIGEIAADEELTFSFPMDIGTTIIEVWAIDFAPAVLLQNGRQDETLAEDTNSDGDSRVLLRVDNSGDDFYRGTAYIVLTSANGRGGQFALRLASEAGLSDDLPPGQILQTDQALTGSVSADSGPVVYEFTNVEDATLNVSVRSTTEDFSPLISLIDLSGNVVSSAGADDLYGASFLLKPSPERYKLVIGAGEFSGAGEFALQLTLGPVVGNDGTIGFDVPPQSGCYLTADTQVNIRDGGSVDHAPVAVLGRAKYLIAIGYNGENGTWYAVALPDGRTGWIASAVTTLDGSCDNLPLRTYMPVE